MKRINKFICIRTYTPYWLKWKLLLSWFLLFYLIKLKFFDRNLNSLLIKWLNLIIEKIIKQFNYLCCYCLIFLWSLWYFVNIWFQQNNFLIQINFLILIITKKRVIKILSINSTMNGLLGSISDSTNRKRLLIIGGWTIMTTS